MRRTLPSRGNRVGLPGYRIRKFLKKERAENAPLPGAAFPVRALFINNKITYSQNPVCAPAAQGLFHSACVLF